MRPVGLDSPGRLVFELVGRVAGEKHGLRVQLVGIQDLRRSRRRARRRRGIDVLRQVPLHVRPLQRDAHEAAHVELPGQPQVGEPRLVDDRALFAPEPVECVPPPDEQMARRVPLYLRLDPLLVADLRVRVIELLAIATLEVRRDAARRSHLRVNEHGLRVEDLAVPELLLWPDIDLHERLKRAVEREERLCAAPEQATLSIARVVQVRARTQLRPPAARSLPDVPRLDVVLHEIDARDEAGIRAKTRIASLVEIVRIPVASAVAVLDPVRVAVESTGRLIELSRDIDWVFGSRRKILKAQEVLVVDAVPTVDAADVVGVAIAVAQCEQRADGRRVTVAARVATDDAVVRLRERRRRRAERAREQQIRHRVPGHERPEGVGSEPTGQLRAEIGVGDRACVDGRQRAVVIVGALEKKRPRFGVEQRELRVLRKLRYVGLHLRKIGVDREIRGDVGRDPPAHSHTELRVEVAVRERTVGSCRPRVRARGREARHDFEVATGCGVR